MVDECLSYELDEDDNVTITLSKSAKISLTDIAAATIGNLSEDAQWGDNSTTATDSGLPVLRPWEDNSESDKPGAVTQDLGYSDKQPPTYQEHLKRKLSEDETNLTTEDISKRLKIDPLPVTKDTTIVYSYTLPATSTDNCQNPLEHTDNKDLSQTFDQGSQQYNSFQTFIPVVSIQNTLQNFMQPMSTKNSMHSITVASQSSRQNVSAQNSMQNVNVASQNSMQSASTQNSIHVSTKNSMQNLSTQNSMQKKSDQDSLQSVKTRNILQNFTLHNSSLNFLNNSELNPIPQSSSNENDSCHILKHHYQTIDQQQLCQTMKATSSPNQNLHKIYFPWTDTSVMSDKRNTRNIDKQSYNKQYLEQTQQLSSTPTSQSGMPNPTLPSLVHQPPKYPMATQIYQIQPLQPSLVNWQTPNISVEQEGEKKPLKSEFTNLKQSLSTFQPATGYLPMSDILQNISATEENKTRQSPWQHAVSPYQPWESQSKSYHECKQEPATPTGKGQLTISKYDSPGIDSRFTESLSNLLGSPPPDSPLSKNPFLGDLQALLNRECKREIVPQSLFGMHGSNKESDENKILNVFERERNLQDRFTNLQSSHPEDIRQLSSMFRYQSALIETERFRTLHECQYPGSYKESVNRHYDNQLHKVMDRVERSVELLENANKENKANKATKMRPHLSKDAVRLMEHWYQQNLSHPYPTSSVIEMLAQAGNIGIEQVKKWFANKRNRSSNTRTLTEIAMQKRKLGQMPGKC